MAGDTSAGIALQQVREKFLSEGDSIDPSDPRSRPISSATRPDIATSWRRSRAAGVAPDRIDVPYTPPPRMPRRLLTASSPVVDRLAVDLDGTSGTILLADSEVRIIDRRVGRSSLLGKLDGLNIAPGFVFAEEFVGTNGLGCAIEEGRQFEVREAEHFRDTFQSLVCIAQPIRHPVRRTVIGALNVTCALDDYGPFARVVIRRAVADIEQRLLESTAQYERMVLDEFITRTRRSSRPSIAVADDIFIGNPAAEALLGKAERSTLWHWAAAMLGSAPQYAETLELVGGATVQATATRLGDGPRVRGALISLQVVATPRYDAADAGLSRTGRRDRIGCDAIDSIGYEVSGRSIAAAQLRSAMVRAVRAGKPFVVTGEEGSGRRLVALSVLKHLAPAMSPVVVDIAADDSWLRQSRTAIADRVPLLLRNLQLADAESAMAIRSVVEAATATQTGFAATSSQLPTSLAGIFSIGIVVPPLRERAADIRELSAALLDKINGGDLSPTLHPAVIRAFQHRDWPGNVRELQLVLSLASQVCVGAEILPRHLPDQYRAQDDGLTRLERVEREAIVQVLQEAHGNKRAAAAALGLARSTLYRKLRTLRISTD